MKKGNYQYKDYFNFSLPFSNKGYMGGMKYIQKQVNDQDCEINHSCFPFTPFPEYHFKEAAVYLKTLSLPG